MKTIVNPLTICVLACAVLFAGCCMDGSGSRLDEDEPDLIEMLTVLGGDFEMGDSNISPPVHQVTVGSFYMGIYQITQNQFTEVMEGYNPSIMQGDDPLFLPAPEEDQGERPVENVTWYEALVFCNRLSMQEEKYEPVYSINGETDPAEWGDWPKNDDPSSPWNNVLMNIGATGYRLPTEAEWEYAARGGKTQKDFKYSGSDDLEKVAWYASNRGSYYTHQVGFKMSNDLGIYDMTGNVYEWCWDWHGDYSDTGQKNPVGPSEGSRRVLRGGSNQNGENDPKLMNVGRHNLPPFQPPSYTTGFRVARSMPSE